MSKYTYDKILSKAKLCTTSVSNEYKLGVSTKWGYYFGEAVLNPKKDVTKISFDKASNPSGTHISRQVKKADYLDIARRLVAYVKKHKQLPNYISYGKYRIKTKVYVLMLAKILVSYSKNNKLPSEVNVNSKAFTKPVETGNSVYDYTCNKLGKKFKTIDDLIAFAKNYFKYLFYFDDIRSNKEVVDDKAGNCTDLLQWLINNAEAMGYEWKVIHTKCKVSGTGHVYGKFRHPKNTNGNWITRDIACIVDEKRSCVWCDVDEGKGYKLAENPSWFIANLRR